MRTDFSIGRALAERRGNLEEIKQRVDLAIMKSKEQIERTL